jgi:periplasmic protein TonB
MGNTQLYTSLDELVFENRNKEYGAYQMRKKNTRHLGMATLIALMLFGIVVVAPKIYAAINNILEREVKELPLDKNIIVQMEDVKPQKDEQVVVEEPPPTLEKAIKFIAPEVAKDVNEKDELATQEELKESQAGKETVTTGLDFGSLVDTNATKTVDMKVEEKPFLVVEEMAEFPGGTKFLYEFLQKNIQYPQKCIDNDIEGKVYLRFVVGSNGTIKNVEVARSVDPDLDREAIRVIKMMPKWKPARQSGKEVPVYYTLPVQFVLSKK